MKRELGFLLLIGIVVSIVSCKVSSPKGGGGQGGSQQDTTVVTPIRR